jgi:hypothetical protein
MQLTGSRHRRRVEEAYDARIRRGLGEHVLEHQLAFGSKAVGVGKDEFTRNAVSLGENELGEKPVGLGQNEFVRLLSLQRDRSKVGEHIAGMARSN